MRFDKAESLIRLGLMLQASREGLSLDDVRREFSVSRRTAERMRDAVLRLFPQTEAFRAEGSTKRWRIPSPVVSRLAPVDATELSALDTAIAAMRRGGLSARTTALQRLATKIRAFLPADTRRRHEVDGAVLAEADALVARPGPRPRVDPEIENRLRDAVLRCVEVRLLYRRRDDLRSRARIVRPFGFLYGGRGYLVASRSGGKDGAYLLYDLSRIRRIVLTERPFRRDPDFSLGAWAAESFGVFREPDGPFDVAWRFPPNAAKSARDYVFHPGQATEDRPDGSLIVRFRAYGLDEMCWHLFKWRGEVEILSPPRLRKIYRNMRARL